MMTYLVHVCNFRKDPSEKRATNETEWIDTLLMPYMITTDPRKAWDAATNFFLERVSIDPKFHSMLILGGEMDTPHTSILSGVGLSKTPFLLFHIRRLPDKCWSGMVWNDDFRDSIGIDQISRLAKEHSGDMLWPATKRQKPA